MKVLAIEKDVPGISDEQCEPHLRDEAVRVWELLQEGVIREIYFRGDRDQAVLILECDSESSAAKSLGSLPLVKRGFIDFDIIPLKAYPGFARLFRQ